jgi:hypothetical protein
VLAASFLGRCYYLTVELKMKTHFAFLFVFATMLSSCSQSPHKTQYPASIPKADSTTIGINHDKEKYFSVVRGQINSKEWSIIVKSVYILPDSLRYDSSFYCKGNFLFVINNRGIVLDSIELAEGCEDGVIVQDVTKQLHFRNPLFSISTPAGSDNYTSEFIGYSNDSLKKLFEIFEFGHPATLQWKDEHTLTGFVKNRDELVYSFQDYPITVSLDNYEVKYEKPEKQEISYTTEALDDVSGYRLSLNNQKTKYLIKKGTTILIASLNRITNTVRIIVQDTIVIYVPFTNIKDKVQVNAAG